MKTEEMVVVVVHAFNPITEEAKAGESVWGQPSLHKIQGHSELYDVLSQTPLIIKKKNGKFLRWRKSKITENQNNYNCSPMGSDVLF